MSIDRAHVAVEAMIADHIAVSFQRNADAPKVETTASQIRSRITDQFERTKPGSEQDNRPPALTELRNRIIEIFGPVREEPISHVRAEALEGLQQSLERLRGTSTKIAPQGSNPMHLQLLLERQQLSLKNEFTEGFGCIETWLVSIAALGLVLLNAIDFFWALPILAAGIGRSWILDRRCKKRHARIAKIDALIGMDNTDGD